MTEKIGRVSLIDDWYPGNDLYSDGAAEDELLGAVKNTPPSEYDRVIEEKRTWPFLYHLSHIRANLLAAVPFSGNESVLEIGSGCGALTGALAEAAGSVTCIELSKKRSLINAWRNRDRDGIRILLGNFEEVEKHLTESYDVITLIGVLEYASLYLTGDDPYTALLSIVRKHLKKNGRLILAIENRLGMKYWAGCQEDHVGGVFTGIDGYPGNGGQGKIRTFSKNELLGLFRKAGFEGSEFFYPYPDYKLPTAIYADGALPEKGSIAVPSFNFDRDRLRLFDEKAAFDDVLGEDAFPAFSNSYLVILTESSQSPGTVHSDLVHFTKTLRNVHSDLVHFTNPMPVKFPADEEALARFWHLFGRKAIPAAEQLKGSARRQIHVYFDRGAGFSEADSIYPAVSEDEGVLTFTAAAAEDMKIIRIDPGEDPCLLTGFSAEWISGEPAESSPVQGFLLRDGSVFFGAQDPQILVSAPGRRTELRVSFRIQTLSKEAAAALAPALSAIPAAPALSAIPAVPAASAPALSPLASAPSSLTSSPVLPEMKRDKG